MKKRNFEGMKLILIIYPIADDILWLLIYVLSVAFIAGWALYERARRKKMKILLEKSEEEKELVVKMDRSKFDLFEKLSHELQTPLILNISQIEALMNSKGLNNLIRNKMGKLYKNAFYMRHLLNELLDFHKLEQSQLRLNVSYQDIIPFLRDVYLSFKEKAVSQGLNYRFDIHPDVLLCWFDPIQLRKVFFNLLSNAFKYTREGDTVELTVVKEENSFVICVLDTGIGMQKEDINLIFERHYHKEREKQKTGIGLMLSKEIVDLHHGNIVVESKPEYGTVFIVRLMLDDVLLRNDSRVTLEPVSKYSGQWIGKTPSISLDSFAINPIEIENDRVEEKNKEDNCYGHIDSNENAAWQNNEAYGNQIIRKVEMAVEAHLDDPDFDVCKLAKEIGVSRTQLFKIMKNWTRNTPAEFILNYRLKIATGLLLGHPEWQIEEIALKLGFSSGRYFSKCFKEHYHVSPMQYRKQKLPIVFN